MAIPLPPSAFTMSTNIGLPMTLILICNASDRFLGVVDAAPARIHPREANEPGIAIARYLVEP
jgi:hypothetical protein